MTLKYTNIARKKKKKTITNLIDDSLHQIILSLQRRVQKQSQGVEFHPHAVADALRSNLAQIRPFPLRKADAWFNYIQRSTLPDTLEENVYFVLGEVNLFFFFFLLLHPEDKIHGGRNLTLIRLHKPIYSAFPPQIKNSFRIFSSTARQEEKGRLIYFSYTSLILNLRVLKELLWQNGPLKSSCVCAWIKCFI